MNWDLIFALPNLTVRAPVEWDWVAIVPPEDERVHDLERRHPLVNQYLAAFTDQNGNAVSPAVLIATDSSEEKYPFDAIMDFRNSLAIACIVEGYGQKIKNKSFQYPVYSEHFDFYPIAPSIGYDDLICISPVVHSLYDIEGFRGQGSAGIGNSNWLAWDEKLLQALMKAWHSSHSRADGDNSRNTQLFRSIEMAYHATAAGLMNPETQYAWGAKLALWVSAFEILAHDGNVNKDKVIELFFARGKSQNTQLSQPVFEMLSKLYSELNAVRNDFLHGNPISDYRVWPFGNQANKPFTAIAPLLYKIALLNKMNYSFDSDNDRALFESSIVNYLQVAVPSYNP